VREDDERCIRAAPPPAPRPPPRFAIGTHVECNGGPRGWSSGVVREHWVEGQDGGFAPYRVDLDGPSDKVVQVTIGVDDDQAVRVQHRVAYDAWADDKGVEAVYDLLTAGKLRDDKNLPRVGLCGEEAAVDALTDAVAACGTESRRVSLMLDQILETAEAATPLHTLVGQRVRVRGLEGSGSSAGLNGECGLARIFLPERDRYEVQLEGKQRGAQTVAVRAVNLEPAAESMVTCPICMDARLTDPLKNPAKYGPGEGTATVTLCCGKVVCKPCHDKFMIDGVKRSGNFPPCPFCREPTGHLEERIDARMSRELLKRLATQGDPVAMYNLSGSYDAGRHGLPKDYQASLAWAALSAMVGGHVRAMNNVGYALKDGEGVPRPDPRRAMSWFLRAAPLGHISCIYAAGRAYKDGQGVEIDLVAAQRWLMRGKDLGDFACGMDLAQIPSRVG
jgi:hypothetical protein